MKYVGSKSKIAKHIVPIIQKFIDENDIEWYVEPFVGGANIIDKINCKYRYGFDIDNLVIDLYNATQNCPLLLKQLPEMISRELYYDVRDKRVSCPSWVRSAILLFASYNARVYGGCYGAIAKTKDGKIRNYYQEAINNYKKQLPSLANVKFYQMDYKDLEIENCVVYCDPPYAEGVGYNCEFNQVEFWDWVRKISKNNIVLVSENNAPEDFECIWSMKTKSSLNNREKINKVEKLFILKEKVNG